MTDEINGRTRAKEERLDFLAHCLYQVLPGPRDKQIPKAMLAMKAARYGTKLEDCPPMLKDVGKFVKYFLTKFSIIRVQCIDQEGVTPVYVNGTEFGKGGGYRRGDAKHIRKQYERDQKVVFGVAASAEEWALAAIEANPKLGLKPPKLLEKLGLKKDGV